MSIKTIRIFFLFFFLKYPLLWWHCSPPAGRYLACISLLICRTYESVSWFRPQMFQFFFSSLIWEKQKKIQHYSHSLPPPLSVPAGTQRHCGKGEAGSVARSLHDEWKSRKGVRGKNKFALPKGQGMLKCGNLGKSRSGNNLWRQAAVKRVWRNKGALWRRISDLTLQVSTCLYTPARCLFGGNITRSTPPLILHELQHLPGHY